MDLKRIKEILDIAWLPDDHKEKQILKILSEDERVIPLLLDILNYERERKKKLLGEMNFQLSRALLGLESPDINENHFMDKEIIKFYQKNKGKDQQIGSLFKKIEEPKEGELDEDNGFYNEDEY